MIKWRLKLCTRSNATQRDRWPLCDTDRYGAASSRPSRTTSTRSPEALLRCTHASRLQRGQARALAAAMSCEHRCDRKGRKSVRSGLQHGHGQGCDWCWTVGFERKGTWLRECTASRLL